MAPQIDPFPCRWIGQMSRKSMSKASEPQSVHFCGWERHQLANGASHVIVAGNATFAENATLGWSNACAF